MAYGKKVWIFPDAELPPVGVNLIPGHESVIITNVSDQVANVKFTLLYTDKDPVSFTTQVEAMRVRCLRTNEEKDFGEFTAKFDEQYAICWRAMYLSSLSMAVQNPEPSISIPLPVIANNPPNHINNF